MSQKDTVLEMRGLSQTWPLTVDRILDHARSWRPNTEIATRTAEGRVVRVTYAELHARARRLSAALQTLGVVRGDTIAILGANSHRQLEAWYAVAGIGAVAHALNPRLPADRLARMLREGGHRALFIDPDLIGGLEGAIGQAPGSPVVIAMGETHEASGHAAGHALGAIQIHDALIEQATSQAPWGGFDEDSPVLILDTLGATGEPKRTVWSHRAAVLSAMIAKGADALDLRADETVAVLIPFAQAGAFGAVFAAPAAGARLVLPGARTDAPSIHALLENEAAGVLVASGADVQTLFDHLQSSGGRLSTVKRIVAAGGHVPPGLATDLKDRFGVRLQSAWGLTETAGLGAVADASGALRPPFGLEIEITDGAGNTLPRDAAGIGRVKARGASVASGYLGQVDGVLDARGFLDTGDLGAIDPEGRLRLTDRAAEVINAGGIWISPRAIEAAALDHPATAEAAVIAYSTPDGVERPLLVVRRRPGASAGRAEYVAFLQRRLSRGQIPADILFVEGLPLDAAHRIDKRALRDRLDRHRARAESAAASAPPAGAAAAAAVQPVLYAPAPPPPDPELVALAASAPDAFAPREAAFADLSPPSVPSVDPQPDSDVLTASPPQDDSQTIDLDLDPAPSPLGSVPVVAEAAGGNREPGAATEASPASAPPDAPPEQVERSPVVAEEAGAFAETLTAPVASDPPGEDEERPLAVSPLGGGQRRRSRPQGLAVVYLNLALVIAVLPLLVIAGGVAAVRFNLIDGQYGVDEILTQWPFRLAMVGVVTGLVGLFAALFSGFSKVWRRAVLGLAIPVLIIAGLIAVRSKAEGQPPIHQAATDWVDPVMFSDSLMRARGPEANPVEAQAYVPADARLFANRTVADVNVETCPSARPIVLSSPPAQAFARARAAVEALGWAPVSARPSEGVVEATASSLLLGFRDDIAIRVRPDGDGARIDARSVSRSGRTDQGRNCANLRAFADAIGSQASR